MRLWLNASEYTLGCRLLDLGVVQFGCRNIISGYLYTRSGLFDRDSRCRSKFGPYLRASLRLAVMGLFRETAATGVTYLAAT